MWILLKDQRAPENVYILTLLSCLSATPPDFTEDKNTALNVLQPVSNEINNFLNVFF